MFTITGTSGKTLICEDSPRHDGGQAFIYQATDEDGFQHAVKIARDEAAGLALTREMEILTALMSSDAREFVVSLEDSGEHEGRPFLVFPWYEATLQAWLGFSGRPRPVEQRLTVLEALCRSVDAVHYDQQEQARGIVHRDIKPSNTFVVEEDGACRVLLGDFGIALFDLDEEPRTNDALGSQPFSALEQRMLGLKLRPNPSWDIYALGATLFFGITGHSPRCVLKASTGVNLKGHELLRLARQSDRDAESDHKYRTLQSLPFEELVDKKALSSLEEPDIQEIEARLCDELRGRVRHPELLSRRIARFLGEALRRALQPLPRNRHSDPRNLVEAISAARESIELAVQGKPNRFDAEAFRPGKRLVAGVAIALGLPLLLASSLLVQGRAMEARVEGLPAWVLEHPEDWSFRAKLSPIDDPAAQGPAGTPRVDSQGVAFEFGELPWGRWRLTVEGGLLDEQGNERCRIVETRDMRLFPGIGRQVYSVGTSIECPTGKAGYATKRIGPGIALLGSPIDEPGREKDELQREERVPSAYELGVTEVSQGLYREVMGRNPMMDAQIGEGSPTTLGDRASCASLHGISLVGDDLPVACVSWCDALRFANRLSELEQLRPAYKVDASCEDGREVVRLPDSDGWRLPTRAEWTRAARAGAQYPLFSGLAYGAESADSLEKARSLACRFGNVLDQAYVDEMQSLDPTKVARGPFPCNDGVVGLAPVGHYAPNDWGLSDLSGNVAEWVWDEYPLAPSCQRCRLHLGGAFYDEDVEGPKAVDTTRLANLSADYPSSRSKTVGIRLTRSVLPPTPKEQP